MKKKPDSRILSLARKLRAMADRGTEHEKVVAALKLQNLVEEYDLPLHKMYKDIKTDLRGVDAPYKFRVIGLFCAKLGISCEFNLLSNLVEISGNKIKVETAIKAYHIFLSKVDSNLLFAKNRYDLEITEYLHKTTSEILLDSKKTREAIEAIKEKYNPSPKKEKAKRTSFGIDAFKEMFSEKTVEDVEPDAESEFTEPARKAEEHSEGARKLAEENLAKVVVPEPQFLEDEYILETDFLYDVVFNEHLGVHLELLKLLQENEVILISGIKLISYYNQRLIS